MLDSIYLAMTAAEIDGSQKFPGKLAYMACHFSPYGTGLSNFPKQLPKGSLLIVNDRTPVCGHDSALIAQQLELLLKDFHPQGILLDLQRPGDPENQQLASRLCQALPGKIIVSHYYAASADCPVFLPPLPLNMPLDKHIAPWKGRKIWLDVCCHSAKFTVTAQNCTVTPLSNCATDLLPFSDESLHCNYSTAIFADRAEFTLQRNKNHLCKIMEAGNQLGIAGYIGLYQEFNEITPRK